MVFGPADDLEQARAFRGELGHALGGAVMEQRAGPELGEVRIHRGQPFMGGIADAALARIGRVVEGGQMRDAPARGAVTGRIGRPCRCPRWPGTAP